MIDAAAEHRAAATPLLSVIIPTYGRPAELRGCLASLAQQSIPPERFEVIVVDDGSPEPLDAVIAPFVERLDVRLLPQANAGPSVARNTGAAAARGCYLVFTDDDCRPTASWLEALERRFQDAPDRLIGGRTTNGLESNVFSTASQVIGEIAYAFYNPTPDTATFFASNNMAVPRQRFLELGGFDPAFRIASEDRELCDRWRHAGGRLLYAPDCVVSHSHALTLGSFTRQHFGYGRGAHRYHRVRKERGSGRLRDDMRFHLMLPGLLRPPMSRLSFWRAIRVALVLALWQIANALGFFYEKGRAGRPIAPSDHAVSPIGASEARRSGA